MKRTHWLLAILALLFISRATDGSLNRPNPESQGWMHPALQWISTPFRETARLNYVLNARVRLLLFWVGAEDVGGGYIARGTLPQQPSSSVTKVLFGSDPARAPRKINHWGAAMEIHIPEAGETAFFGLMKSSKATSAKEAEAEVSKEGGYGFEGAIGHATGEEVISRLIPLASLQDFTIRDLERAQSAILKRATEHAGAVRRLSLPRAGCSMTRGFLNAVQELIDDVTASRPVPRTLCYVHNSRYYTITVRHVAAVERRKVKVDMRNGPDLERSYQNLRLASFEIYNTESGERTRFEMSIGSEGNVRGVPVQILYQPNWWFQIVLNLS